MAHKELDKEDKLCNTCQHRGIKKMEKPDIVQTAQLLVTVSYADQVQIEELCTNRGISISDYFVSLYHLDTSDRIVIEHEGLNNPNRARFNKETPEGGGFVDIPTDIGFKPIEQQEEKKKAGRPKR